MVFSLMNTALRVPLGGLLLSILASGCVTDQQPPRDDSSSSSKVMSSEKRHQGFQLKAVDVQSLTVRKASREGSGKASRKTLVDVNLGNSPEVFIHALWRQTKGEDPSEAQVQALLKKWQDHPRWRRIDVALEVCEQTQTEAVFEYSDPWQEQIELKYRPIKTVSRDLGAVCMFFFNCPDGVNGKMSWANNHAPGMKVPDDICRLEPKDSGYYHPNSKGFWGMELRDASYAGLDFLLLNAYGPDIEGDKLQPLQQALEHLEKESPEKIVKLGLFDDTWTWGKPYFSDHWKQVPDMEQAVECVNLIYESKWKPFFEAIDRRHWYLFEGRPVIYFYNGGTIKNRHNAAEVFRGLKARFKKDFGVEPYLCVDSAFLKPGVKQVADQHFSWFSLGKSIESSSVTSGGKSLSHAMVRWDSTSRANGQVERKLNSKDLLEKNGDLLKKFLDETQKSDMAVLATWNDLGEGTGINRCFDYYWDGTFQSPAVFMDMIRTSQGGERLLTASELERLNAKQAAEVPTIH